MKKIVLLGAGGHAKTVVDTIEKSGIYTIEGFLDVKDLGKEIYHSYKVIGTDDDLNNMFSKGIHNAFVTVGFMGNSVVREKLYKKVKEIGYYIPTIIDETSIVAEGASIGEGTYIGRNAVINSEAVIGKMCIINSASVVEHECEIGDFSHLAVSAVLCGQSRVGRNVMIGANSTIIQNVSIGDDCIIGAGSLVLKDLKNNVTAVGSPAKVIK